MYSLFDEKLQVINKYLLRYNTNLFKKTVLASIKETQWDSNREILSSISWLAQTPKNKSLTLLMPSAGILAWTKHLTIFESELTPLDPLFTSAYLHFVLSSTYALCETYLNLSPSSANTAQYLVDLIFFVYQIVRMQEELELSLIKEVMRGGDG